MSKTIKNFFGFKTQKQNTTDCHLFRKLKKHALAIDCGANLGDVSLKMAEHGATVFAFEPNPYAFDVLHQRLASFHHVHLYNKAVHIKNECMRLYLHENAPQDQVHWSTGSSLLNFKGNVNRNTSVEVQTIDIVEFIRQLNCDVALMKLDVEGVECPIINRLIDTRLVHRVKQLLVETHDHKIPELRAETDALRKRINGLQLQNIFLDWV